jgi:hypothetical protein
MAPICNFVLKRNVTLHLSFMLKEAQILLSLGISYLKKKYIIRPKKLYRTTKSG